MSNGRCTVPDCTNPYCNDKREGPAMSTTEPMPDKDDLIDRLATLLGVPILPSAWHQLNRTVEALEGLLSSPSAPTEDDREALARAICAADEQTLDYERCRPDPPFDADGLYDEQWKAYLPHADAAIATRRSPVAPSEDVAP